MKQSNRIVQLRKYLNKEAKLGVFDNASPELIETIDDRVSTSLRLFFGRLLRQNINYFMSRLKRNFYNYKKNITERHKIDSYKFSDLNSTLRDRFNSQRSLALNLIKTQNEENMLKLKRRFMDWVTLKSVGNDKEKLSEMTKIPSNKHIKFILKDQTSKMINSFDKEVSEHYGGALAFQWKVNNDNRVVGKPGGVNPKSKNPEMHGDHWARRDKWYYNPAKKKELQRLGVDLKKFAGDYNTPKDGMPGMPIGCRCWAYYIYDVEDLPSNFVIITKIKGVKYA